TVEKRTRDVAANGPGQPASRYETNSRADELDRRHQGKSPECGPQESGAEGRPGDRVGGDAARVIVGGAGDEPGSQGPEIPQVPTRACAGGRVEAAGPA